MRLALQHKGIRTEALARTDEMESLFAFFTEDIRGVMTGKGKINDKQPKASYMYYHSVFNVNIIGGNCVGNISVCGHVHFTQMSIPV